ncbi:uncharacterized protein LOC116430815 isoform X1 [Nomia melanderi]|uniref:uncharacterized protein LOC116430815 isoform X1 n=1 Tax=Nomia melanderi TaxID=2448451 RepID=UPI003FCCF708
MNNASQVFQRSLPNEHDRDLDIPLAERKFFAARAVFGQTFDEIVVSSDLNVRRKSKENREGKRLTNIPSGTTGPPEKSTVVASRFVSDDGTRITSEKKQQKRETSDSRKRYLDMGVAGYLLKSRKR